MLKYLFILPVSFLFLKYFNNDLNFLSQIQFYYLGIFIAIILFFFRKNLKVIILTLILSSLYFAYTYISIEDTVLVDKIVGDHSDRYRTIFTLKSNQILKKINSSLSFVNNSVSSRFLIKGNEKYLYVFENKKGKLENLFMIPTQPLNETTNYIIYILAGLSGDEKNVLRASKIVAKWSNNSHRAYAFYYLGYHSIGRYRKTGNLADKTSAIRYLNYGLKFESTLNRHLISKIKNAFKVLEKIEQKIK